MPQAVSIQTDQPSFRPGKKGGKKNKKNESADQGLYGNVVQKAFCLASSALREYFEQSQ
jgi:hypothetical protein